jgi:FkbM family methyltransferase
LKDSLPVEEELRALGFADRPSIIFDIGACEAEDSVRYSRTFPMATVYAFEPLPANAEKAAAAACAFGGGKIRVVQLALSDVDGSGVLHVSSGRPPLAPEDDTWDYGNKSNSLLTPDKTLMTVPWLRFEQSIAVRTMRATTFCNEQKIPTVDFIHMDVQGAELKVLLGLDLEKLQVKAIWTEVATEELYRGQPLLGDLQNYLAARGYWMFRLELIMNSGDALFVSRRSALLSPAFILLILRRRVSHLRNRIVSWVRRAFS